MATMGIRPNYQRVIGDELRFIIVRIILFIKIKLAKPAPSHIMLVLLILENLYLQEINCAEPSY